MAKSDTAPFTLAERALIRLEFMVRFGQEPSVAEGIWLRKWRGGPKAGQPCIPAAVASMLERGLVEVAPGDLLGARTSSPPSVGQLAPAGWASGAMLDGGSRYRKSRVGTRMPERSRRSGM